MDAKYPRVSVLQSAHLANLQEADTPFFLKLLDAVEPAPRKVAHLELVAA
jgi:hypothetical protein